MTTRSEKGSKQQQPKRRSPPPAARPPAAAPAKPKEVGGREGPEPTRYGDWEVKGICVDF